MSSPAWRVRDRTFGTRPEPPRRHPEGTRRKENTEKAKNVNERTVTARRCLPWQSPRTEMLIQSEDAPPENPSESIMINSGGDCHAANGFRTGSGNGGG